MTVGVAGLEAALLAVRDRPAPHGSLGATACLLPALLQYVKRSTPDPSVYIPLTLSTVRWSAASSAPVRTTTPVALSRWAMSSSLSAVHARSSTPATRAAVTTGSTGQPGRGPVDRGGGESAGDAMKLLDTRAGREHCGHVSDSLQRWTAAQDYPDMWADPGQDPRNSDGVSPDGELATLLDYLTSYRLTLLMKCEGLNPEQLARRSVPPSSMSLLGLLRHLAEVERDWRRWFLPEDAGAKLYGGADDDFKGAAGDQALVDTALDDLTREQAATDAALAEHSDMGERLGIQQIAVRELLVHRIEEYARHCGHADLLRECIDGRIGQ